MTLPTSPQKRSTFSPRVLRLFGLCLGIGWAIFVVIRYVSVDNGFVFDLIRVYDDKILLNAFFTGISLLGGSALLGYTAGQTHRRKIIIGAFSLIAISVIGLILHSTIQSAWFKMDNLPDGARASLVLAMAALSGVGIGIGTRISHHPVTLGFLATCLLFPFLFITLRAGAITSLLALVWLFLISDALGMLALRWFNRLTKTPSANLERAGLLSVAVGLGILILGTLGLGLVGGTSSTGILLALLLLSVLCFAQIKSSLMRLAALPWSQPVALSEFELGGLAMLAALFLVYWIGALAPEVGADALGFRIAAPAIWLREGGIRPLPEMLGSYGLFAGEMLHLLVMPLTGFTAAKIVQFGLAGLLVVSSSVQVFELRYRKEAALMLLAFWGSTLIWWQMIWGFVDISQMFFYFACILALRFWLDEPESPIWLIAAGIAGATATTIKLNGAGALVIAGLVVVGITLYRSRSFKKIIQNSIYLCIPALLCLLPWLIRSYWLTKNPLFPFAYQIFKSPLILSMPVASFGVGLSFPDVLGVPWGIFFDPARFGSLGTYHPLILAFAVLGTIGLVWVFSRKDWLWLGAGTLAYIFWLVTEQNSRYSLFAIFFLLLAFGIGLLKWQDRFTGRIQRGIFQLLLLIGLVWGFGMQALRPTFWMQGAVSGQAFPTKVVFGEQSGFDYLTNTVPSYFCAEWLNRHYGQNAKIWQVPPLRDHLYFDAPVSALPHGILPVTQPLDEILLGQAGNDASVYQRLVVAGYTHLVYDIPLMPSLSDVPDFQRQGIFSTAFETTYLQLECADRGLRLYKIRPTPIPATTPIQFQPNLLANSGLETLNAAGLPLDWDLAGNGIVILSAGNTVLRLEGGATITQAVAVNDDVSYELSLDYRAITSDPTATIQINWLDSSGRLRLFWREPVNPTDGFVSYRFLQTVPAGVETAVVFISGSGIEVDNIILHEIPLEIQVS